MKRVRNNLFFPLIFDNISSLAQAKHEAFIKARGRHYSNEAEAMKVSSPTLLFRLTRLMVLIQMAQKLIDEEDDEAEEEETNGVVDDDVSMDGDEPPKVNGVVHGA